MVSGGARGDPLTLQADGDAGGAVQHRQDHLHPIPPGTGARQKKCIQGVFFDWSPLNQAMFQA